MGDYCASNLGPEQKHSAQWRSTISLGWVTLTAPVYVLPWGGLSDRAGLFKSRPSQIPKLRPRAVALGSEPHVLKHRFQDLRALCWARPGCTGKPLENKTGPAWATAIKTSGSGFF